MSDTSDLKTELTPEETEVLVTLSGKGVSTVAARCSDAGYSYTGLEDQYEGRGEAVSSILESLKGKNYLRVTKYDYFLACPSGKHTEIKTNYLCPFCQSRQVKKIRLVEHTLCGYIGDSSEFQREGTNICPKCKREIGKDKNEKQAPQRNDSLKMIGSNFLCETCGGKFEKPVIAHTCYECGKDFTYKDASYLRLPAYEVIKQIENPKPMELQTVAETTTELKPAIEAPAPTSTDNVIKTLSDYFAKKGYTFETNAKIIGKSGAEQIFSAVATKDKKRILIDAPKMGNQTDVISLIGKKSDVDAESIILIDTTGSQFIASLGRKYNLTIITGKSGETESLDKIIDLGEKHDKRPAFRWPRKK